MASVLSVLFDKVLKQIKSTDTGGGGVPQRILGGGVPPRSPNSDPISDQKM